MRNRLLFAPLAAAFACSLLSAPAQAQRARTFVASYGNDSNPCTFGSPCKTFQQAVNVVAAGGEVTAIDSAGFGPITITQAVTITSPDGVEAGIVPRQCDHNQRRTYRRSSVTWAHHRRVGHWGQRDRAKFRRRHHRNKLRGAEFRPCNWQRDPASANLRLELYHHQYALIAQRGIRPLLSSNKRDTSGVWGDRSCHSD